MITTTHTFISITNLPVSTDVGIESQLEQASNRDLESGKGASDVTSTGTGANTATGSASVTSTSSGAASAIGQKPFVYISRVVIPSIQRAYAQGRTTPRETKIRKGFLDAIFDHLVNNKVMDLHFIYGAVTDYHDPNGNTLYQLELLDGQQRFTTLYLLHWYLLNREYAHIVLDPTLKDNIERALCSFEYLTRTTSTEFCHSFAQFQCDLTNTKPSEAIKKARWYYNRFDNDSTIQGMLVMLDAIHEKYGTAALNLIDHIDNLQFYVLPLVDYKMSEELYIKMNARGLPITAFDSFKSEFTGAMKSAPALSSIVSLPDGSPVSRQERISIYLDTKWIDIFWKPGRTDYDVHYMRFFSRFFAYRYMLDSGLRGEQMQNPELPINVFYTQSEDKEKRNEFLGFEKYAEQLRIHPDYFGMIETVLDTLYDSNNMLAIHNMLRPIWEPKQQGNFFVDADVPFSQSLLVIFGAICDFIIEFPTFDEKIFRQWMRVVWNVVENTNIDSLRAATGPLRNLHTLLVPVAKAAPTTIQDFYTQVSLVSTSLPRAFKEEIEKAQRIASDQRWLAEFIDAEKHPYLKGSVEFFYDSSLNINDFIHNRDLVKDMFDKDGITSTYREQHILIRAIVSNLKQWNDSELQDRYITEKSERDKRLKLLLLGNNDVRLMFVDVLQKSTSSVDVIRLLALAINNNRTNSYRGLTDWQLQLSIAHNSLCDDVKLFDWMATQPSPVCVSWYKGHIAVSIPRVWYDRFFIDSERDQIAISLMSRLWLRYVDVTGHASLQDYYSLGRFKGESILLSRGINKGISFHVDFLKDHSARVYLKCTDDQCCHNIQENINTYLGANPTIKSSIPNFCTSVQSKDDEQIYRLYLDVDANGNYRSDFRYLLYKVFPTSEIMKIYHVVTAVI